MSRQRGIVMILLVFMMGLAGTAFLLNYFSGAWVRLGREQQTTRALAEAKAALMAFAASGNLNAPSCGTNCPRPGDLPCPDLTNDGTAETSCGSADGATGQTRRIGRLPWRTLGMDDLRDGWGERLWYAVSSRYKNNARYRPLNSDTTGTITLRNAAGVVVNDGSSASGIVAVVFSPGAAILRQDGLTQMRDASRQNNAANYLDIALGEDNADFIDSSAANGFVMGPVKEAGGNEIVNDRLLLITRGDIISAMETRVLAETMHALLDDFCGAGNANYLTRSCIGAGGNRIFPNPARFSDATCLGSNNLSSCFPDTAVFHGRIPANPAPAWKSASILRGGQDANWFQLNGWRELIHFAVAPACAGAAPDCAGAGGFLTLDQALLMPADAKQIVLVSAGYPLAAQSRANGLEKTSEANYLEEENVSPLDNIYVRYIPNASVNDRAVSIP